MFYNMYEYDETILDLYVVAFSTIYICGEGLTYDNFRFITSTDDIWSINIDNDFIMKGKAGMQMKANR